MGQMTRPTPRQWGERCLRVSQALFLEICKGKTLRKFRVLTPLPDDAQVVRVGYDPMGALNVIVRSQSWPELGEREKIPDISIQFETVAESEPTR